MSIRVLIVDDSAVICGLMSRALSADSDIVVDGTVANGELAIVFAKNKQPDIIVLDIEMPVMDGITALPELLKVSPKSKIIMASTLTLRNADISLRALSLGAADYLAKPTAKSGADADNFYRELKEKIRALAGMPSKVPVLPPPAQTPTADASPAPAAVTPDNNAVLNPMGIKALAIASSTGGPQALLAVFEQIKGRLQNIPIFITQHMPPTFTTILADHISKAGGRPCIEAKGGEKILPGHAYLAPGNYHMAAEKNAGGEAVLRINQDPPENYCRPAADPMFRSLSRVYGAHLTGLVLTGMGQDGMEGAKDIIRQGGSVVAQDEKTCIVYGMPKAVVDNHLCKAIVPLPDIGAYFIRQIEGR